MATAPAERTKTHFYTVDKIPIIWYMTSTTVAMQGELLQKILLDNIHKSSSLSAIEVIWIPCSGIPDLMSLPRDIYEVIDAVEKAKEIGIKYNVDIKISLATSWLPMGEINHEAALRVFSMNKALLVVGYYWLRCRVTDLVHTTTHEVRGKDKEDTMEIRDLEDFLFVKDMYVDQKHGGLKINEHAGRQIREILRRVFLQYGLEPHWESAVNSHGRFFHIPEPRVFFNGRSRRLPEPTSGQIPTHMVVQSRAEIRQRFIRDESDDRELPPTHLESYPWQYCLARSNRPDYKQPELVPIHLAPLSSQNRILALEVSSTARPIKLTEYEELSAYKPSVPEAAADTTEPASKIKPANKETILVTKVFATSRQSRTPAMDRLGPRVRTTSEPAFRSRSSPRASRDRSSRHNETEEQKQEEEKGEPAKTRKRAALMDDLAADKSSEEEAADAANKSLDDEKAEDDASLEDEDTEGGDQSDLTDEEEASDFRQLLAELTARFEQQQADRREQRARKKEKRTRAEKGDRKK